MECLYTSMCSPAFLGTRTYLHGTTILSLLLDAVGRSTDASGSKRYHLKRFRVLQEKGRCGRVVVVEGRKVTTPDNRYVQAEAQVEVDGESYYAAYLADGPAMTLREPYDEDALVPTTEFGTSMASTVFPERRASSIDEWIRFVVAANKRFCTHYLGKQTFRWISLTDLSLGDLQRRFLPVPHALVVRHDIRKDGIGGWNYLMHTLTLKRGVQELSFHMGFGFSGIDRGKASQ